MLRSVILGGLLFSLLVVSGASAESLHLRMDDTWSFQVAALEKGHAVPPLIPLKSVEDEVVDSVGEWWIGAYDRLRLAAEKRTKGIDMTFRLEASTGLGSRSEPRIGAALTFPFFSRDERLKVEDDKMAFTEKGLALIKEGKSLKRTIRLLQEQVRLQQAALQVEGFGGFRNLQEVRMELLRAQERAWEVKEAFGAMVR